LTLSVLSRLAVANHQGAIPKLDQVFRVERSGPLERRAADEQIGRSCDHLIAAIWCARFSLDMPGAGPFSRETGHS
jgi:hypothetical protein